MDRSGGSRFGKAVDNLKASAPNAEIIEGQYCMLLKEKIIGFFAMYANDTVTKTAFISFIAVGIPYRGSGYGNVLLDKAVQTAKENNMKILKLEVLKDNLIAQQFYKKHGFNVVSESENSIYLEKNI